VETNFLKDLLIVFALGGLVVYALRAIKLPPIVGLLVAGAAMGPHGFSLVEDVHRVEVLAEVGVVLLLFTVGLEFSLGQLLKMWRMLIFGGGGQVLSCIALVALAATFFTDGFGKPLFFGFLAALSSTAIVLRSFAERAQLGSPLGRIVLGVLLFQDLCIVPLMLVTPMLHDVGAVGSAVSGQSLVLTLLEAVGVVVAVLFFARRLVPPLLSSVVRSRSRELFLTTLLVLCLGTAYLTSLAGLSLALGAFLAGLAVSESEYSHQALAEAIPFRDAFGSLFFVSIGMLMDVRFVATEPLLVLGVLLALIVIKTLTAALPPLLLGFPVHLSLNAGLALAQVGEFAFVLSRAGLDLGLIDAAENQVFLAASVLSMLLTPLLIYVGRELGKLLPHEAIGGQAASVDETGPLASTDHVVIAGYGVNGQNLARALSSAGIPYAIVEMNPETVRSARARGEPMHYGDCTRVAVLEALGISRARMYVVAISDAPSTRQTTSLARSLNPDLDILVRTRFVAEVEELRRLGANEVIPEEFETSIEIFARVLHRFDVPKNVILEAVARVRDGMYDMLRGQSRSSRRLPSKFSGLDSLELERLELRDGSSAVGRTLSELELRRTTGATVLAVQRNGIVHPSPAGDFRLEVSDTLLVLGEPSAIDKVLALIDPHVPVS
jgi:CPA2 family monovalent cation:H+ antiporter-2